MTEDFVGTYDHNLDNKGRVIIPAAFRENLGGGFTVAMNSEWNALALYPAGKWESIRQKLARVRDTDPVGMAYKRLVNAYATHVDELDAQGRVVLPKAMRDKAGLDHKIQFIGMGDYIEIWDDARYTRQEADNLMRMEELVRHMDERYTPDFSNTP
ncbi:MAG: division/cell wall cluster transcriptional repressor MraZ [Oscillospiraceae bacterium]|jgi:MraZ protein|nr:division/cell wall cluster transcriptional repressor MraZ [Oscillospiraceae bacterium]